jgi:hypothetical protein
LDAGFGEEADVTFSPDMPERFVYVRLQIDTNRINSHGTLPAMNRIEQWQRDEVIELLTSQVASVEMRQGGHPARSRKAADIIFSFTAAGTEGEADEMERIEAILFPAGARTQSERNDVEIVFNASKYRAILVTNDGDSARQPRGILGSARALRQQLDIRVMRDSEVVAFVEEKIHDRDEMARIVSRETGAPLPPWVGRD